MRFQHSSLFFLFFLSATLIAQEKPTHKCFTALQDPYLWLEDSDSGHTQEWLTHQQTRFNQYFEGKPYRVEMKELLQQILHYEAFSIPVCVGDLYFYKMRSPNEDQHVLYVQQGIEGNARVLLNPNILSKTSPLSLSAFSPSPDGRWVAYGLAESGSDWIVWRVLDVATGETCTDRLERIKFFPAEWSPDSQGFFYSRLDVDDVYRIYYHQLGSLQESDTLVYGNRYDPEIAASPSISSDKKYLLITLTLGASGPNAILFRAFDDPTGPFLTLLPMKEGNHSYLGNEGSTFYFWTNQDSPRGRVIALDAENGLVEEIIPEGSHSLDQVFLTGNYLLAAFCEDVISHLILYDRQGNVIREITLPGGVGTVTFADHSSSNEGDEIFFSFTHFVQPSLIYRYQVETDKLDIFKQPQLTFNPQDYQITQVFYKSKDGTQIPLFIVHKKGLELNGQQETLLYAYGGFGISMNPFYHPLHMAWLENGGVFALANIRGGAEYGKNWHDAGRGNKKQNCFDDFIAAAEWLIANGYTKASKLAIRGASNGGLLMAVCLNQRPDLFGAALVEVGVLDMLRFHLFTVGRFWIVEYGNPEDPNDSRTLCQYSPYHNVRKGRCYPPVMILTGDHDDRVVPLHSFKYAAAMQEATGARCPVLLRVERHGGHGGGKSLSQWIEEAADILTFLKSELGNK